jgi:predicted alpha/beta-hydrolase family hydrolase
MDELRILFAHGAGAPSSSTWMKAWRKRLGAIAKVTSFDYPYMREGRAMPDRLETLIEAHREALRRLGADRVVLAGKSMGSRVGCHLSLVEPVQALVCFGYPLVGIGKKRPVRDAVLKELTTPILFVQGTRDELCPLELLESVRREMKAASSLHVVDGGDHSLAIRAMDAKRTGATQREVDAAILEAVRAFVEEHAKRKSSPRATQRRPPR